MTHSSFSEENNRALSIVGTSIIETSASFKFLNNDTDISAKALNRKISDILSVETSCAVDAMRFGLHKIIRVSPKTNSSSPSVTCGAFRAIFGAAALDCGKSDDAGSVFWDAYCGYLRLIEMEVLLLCSFVIESVHVETQSSRSVELIQKMQDLTVAN